MGKFTFHAGATCLATLGLQDGEQEYRWFPAMVARGDIAQPGLASVYRSADGSFRLRLDDRWIGFAPVAGCLTLNSEVADAATLRLVGEPLGQGWEVQVGEAWKPVVFYPQTAQAILTTNRGKSAVSGFEPVIVTPSLAALVASGQGRGVDLTDVVLDGASVVGVDFTGARFTGASLQGADLSNCLLSEADLRDTRLNGVFFDGALLDHANLSGATLGAPGWGAPRSARGIDLSFCQARGAILGSPSARLDCTHANFSAGDFSHADLSGLQLTGALLTDARLESCWLEGAVLDGADLRNVFALRASLRKCSLKNILGSNANFTEADFSAADLSQARLDAKFHQAGPAPGGTEPPLRPAVLHRATCIDTRASGAHLAGADLRGVQWCGAGATLDHADLEGAVLAGSLLVSLDLSQAFLSGADLSDSVLVDARIAGCSVRADGSARALSLAGAQIQGVDFSDSVLDGALLLGAGVALAQGVPLFRLPSVAWEYLTPEGIAGLAPLFARAGYPLGDAPILDMDRQWRLDNDRDPDLSHPRVYSVRRVRGQLEVFDASGALGHLFTLPGWASFGLDGVHPDASLITGFEMAGYGLSASANIDQVEDPRLRPAADAGIVGAFGYASFRLARREQGVQVFGMAPLLMRDWPAYPAGVAFKATANLAAAMSPDSLGPAGYPRRALTPDSLDAEEFFTAH
ncbi:pentapeptide repeat-containing protein [Pseudomonas sp. Irchel 3E13]|uniref:pentapeptide repeat-containing protein n=1 Tax=Pseudomonas sp. Irchel 3E13 TaxID=2008975 RepID=UPI000BA42F30|nr:pentapeptide repeat-containing protein [Pseudomonas sp. Irchel 3E13]